MLTNDEKLFILYLKGHFDDIGPDCVNRILMDVYMLNREQIHQNLKTNYAIKLFSKLHSMGYILKGNGNIVLQLLQDFNTINTSPLSFKTLYDYLCHHITWITVDDKLALQDVNKIVVRNIK